MQHFLALILSRKKLCHYEYCIVMPLAYDEAPASIFASNSRTLSIICLKLSFMLISFSLLYY